MFFAISLITFSLLAFLLLVFLLLAKALAARCRFKSGIKAVREFVERQDTSHPLQILSALEDIELVRFELREIVPGYDRKIVVL